MPAAETVDARWRGHRSVRHHGGVWGAVGTVAGERLGAGGFGQVWQAHDRALRVDVAIKEVWLPGTVNDSERAQRVVRAERESRNAARLRSHPNIVTVHDVVVENRAFGAGWQYAYQ